MTCNLSSKSLLLTNKCNVRGRLWLLEEFDLTLTTLWTNLAGDKLMIFFLFFPGNRDISCKLTVCMNCQNLFSGKTKKNISIRHLLKILPRVLSGNQVSFDFLTLVLLNPDIPCLCKQCKSRSVGFWIYSNNPDQIIWLLKIRKGRGILIYSAGQGLINLSAVLHIREK